MKILDCDHEFYMFRGRRLVACNCFCRDCHNGMECVCGDCSHATEVHLDPAYYNKINEEEEKAGIVRRYCADCPNELFRKSNKGRWPVRCEDCKAKKAKK